MHAVYGQLAFDITDLIRYCAGD